jgi:hypothetical protein
MADSIAEYFTVLSRGKSFGLASPRVENPLDNAGRSGNDLSRQASDGPRRRVRNHA